MEEKEVFKEDKNMAAEVKKEVSKTVDGIEDLPFYFFGAEAHPSKGATTTEEGAGLLIDSRAVKFEISKDDTGCEWAYENEVSVYNNIQRLCNTFNNGFDVIIPDKLKKGQQKIAEEAQKYIEMKIHKDWMLQQKTDVLIANRGIYGFGILKKRFDGKHIIGLLELDCHEDRCKPIRNSLTGDLGGDTGKGLNPDDSNMEVALIQKAKINKYQSDGNVEVIEKDFYFDRNEIIYWTNNERGKFKGTSPVKRVLRLVEIKKTFENSAELIVRRFGPQIWIIVGNEKYNLSNTRIPDSYMRSGGNPVDLATARENYRKAKFDNIEKAVQKWSDGESMVQIAEFGIEPKIFTPSANVFQYGKYIDQMSDYIKVGIFGLDVAGRVDVTSAVMQDRLFRDLKDRAVRERAILITTYQNELVNPELVAKGYEADLVLLKFKPLDKIELTEEAETERRRSLAVLQYANAGYEVPEPLMKKWELKKLVDVASEGGEPSEPPGLKEQLPVKPEAEK